MVIIWTIWLRLYCHLIKLATAEDIGTRRSMFNAYVAMYS